MRRLIVRLGIAFIVGLFGLISYFTTVSENPVTGEKQRIQLSPRQEVVIGLQARKWLLNTVVFTKIKPFKDIFLKWESGLSKSRQPLVHLIPLSSICFFE